MMNSFSGSDTLLPFADHMRQTRSTGDHATQIDPRSLAEFFRALSRWENEGGAVHVDDTRLLDAYAALS